jgi:hypothetical protein
MMQARGSSEGVVDLISDSGNDNDNEASLSKYQWLLLELDQVSAYDDDSDLAFHGCHDLILSTDANLF